MRNIIFAQLLSIGCVLLFGVLFVAPSPQFQAQAVKPLDEFQKTVGKAVFGGQTAKITTPEQAIGKIINTVLTYIGVAVMVLIIYAGGLWATAQGNEQKIEKAKKILTGSVIGLVIIFGAAAAVNFVIDRLSKAVVN